MPRFFVVVGAGERRGPFETVQEAVGLLKDFSKKCGHTPQQAHSFFLIGSAIEQEDTVGTKTENFRLGWLAREQCGRLDNYSDDNFIVKAA